MRRPLRDIAVSQHGAFSTAQALTCYSHGELRALIRSGRWRRVFTGTYRLGEAEPGPRLRLAAAELSIGRVVPACLHTAAELHGFGVLTDAVTHVAVRPGEACSRRAELWPHQLLERHAGLRGVRQARELVPLANASPDSPQESRLRLRCHDARLPPPTVQFPVFDTRGRARRFVDLAWEEVEVGLEYDGEEGHTGQRALRSDRRRHNFLQDEGWAMFYATDLDVYRDPAELMRKVAAAIARRQLLDQEEMVAPEDRMTTISP